MKKKKFANFFCDIIFFCVLTLIIYFILVYSQNNFPVIKAFFICLLTSIILYFNNFKYAFILIRSRFIQHIGKISYSLFLLHWPIIVFVNYLVIRELKILEKLCLLLIIFILSNILFYLVENKFSKITLSKFFRKIKFFYLLAIFFILISLVAVKYKPILNFKLNSYKVNLLQNIKEQKLYQEIPLENYETEVIDYSKKNILIFGDSHAYDIYFSLKLLNNNYNYLYINNSPICSELLSRGFKLHWFDKFTNLLFKKEIMSQYFFENCQLQYIKINRVISNQKIDKIFISMKWNDTDIHNIDYIFNYFHTENLLDKVYVFSRRLEIPDPERVILFFGENSLMLNDFFNNNKVQYFEINKYLKNKTRDYLVKFVDIDHYILDNNNKFIFFNEKLNKVYFLDYSHFSLPGGLLYMNKLYDSILNE
jgi:hypothetical protein